MTNSEKTVMCDCRDECRWHAECEQKAFVPDWSPDDMPGLTSYLCDACWIGTFGDLLLEEDWIKYESRRRSDWVQRMFNMAHNQPTGMPADAAMRRSVLREWMYAQRTAITAWVRDHEKEEG